MLLLGVAFCTRAHAVHIYLVNAQPPPENYTLSLHDALPIFGAQEDEGHQCRSEQHCETRTQRRRNDEVNADRLLAPDRKSTRLNSSHSSISYAVFCLKKKTKARAGRRRQPRSPRPLPRVHAS